MGYRKNEVFSCSGFSNTWPKKGWPCGASALYKKNGKRWCKNHLPVETDSPLLEAINKARGDEPPTPKDGYA